MSSKVRAILARGEAERAEEASIPRRRLAVVPELKDKHIDGQAGGGLGEVPDESLMVAKTAAGQLVRVNEDYLAQVRGKRLFRDAIVFVIFVTLYSVVVVYSQAGGEEAFYFRSSIEEMLLKDEFPPMFSDVRKTFYNISTPIESWHWLRGVFVPAIFPTNLSSVPPAITVLDTSQLIGAVRIRQQRVKKDSCAVSYAHTESIKFCYAAFSSSDEDTSSFGPGSIWTWKSGKELAASWADVWFWGQFQVYTGSGFAIDLYGNRDTVARQVSFLQANNWIDLQTRVVFITGAFYNPALHFHSVFNIILEFLPSGGVLPSATIRVLKLDKYSRLVDKLLALPESLLLCFVLWYAIEMVISGRKTGVAQFFRNGWNWFDMMNFVLFMLVLSLRASCIIIWQKLNKSPGASYVNYQTLGFLTQQEINWNALNAFLCVWKIFRYLRASRAVAVLLRTGGAAARDIGFFMIIFGVALFSFVLSGYVAFGVDLKDFRTLPQSLFALVRGVNGDLDFEPLYDTNRFFGPLFYITFYVLVFYILMNMFLAIISMAYDVAQSTRHVSTGYNFDFILVPLGRFMTSLVTCFGAIQRNEDSSDNHGGDPRNNSSDPMNYDQSSRDHSLLSYSEIAKRSLQRKRPGLAATLAAQLADARLELGRSEMAYVDELLSQRLGEMSQRQVHAAAESFASRLDQNLDTIVTGLELAVDLMQNGGMAKLQQYHQQRQQPVVGPMFVPSVAAHDRVSPPPLLPIEEDAGNAGVMPRQSPALLNRASPKSSTSSRRPSRQQLQQDDNDDDEIEMPLLVPKTSQREQKPTAIENRAARSGVQIPNSSPAAAAAAAGAGGVSPAPRLASSAPMTVREAAMWNGIRARAVESAGWPTLRQMSTRYAGGSSNNNNRTAPAPATTSPPIAWG